MKMEDIKVYAKIELGEEEEINIFIITEDEECYNIEVKTPIKYKDLKIIIKEKILNISHFHFYIIYEGNKYSNEYGDKNNEDEFMNLGE